MSSGLVLSYAGLTVAFDLMADTSRIVNDIANMQAAGVNV